MSLLSLAFALASVALGWWSAAALGLVWGLMGTRHPALEAAVAAMIGWAVLMALSAGPSFGRLVAVLGAVAPPPGAAYPVAALIVGGVLAALGAVVTASHKADPHQETAPPTPS